MSQGIIDLKGKNALVLGVANQQSLAWAIVEGLANAGVKTAFTYGALSSAKRISSLEQSSASLFSAHCDVNNHDHWQSLKEKCEKHMSKIDVLIHSIAYASPDELSRPLLESSREGFLKAIEVSAYSFIEMTKILYPLLSSNCSIITLSNNGANKVIPGYGMMGIAKAALESSVRYLSYELGKEGKRVNCISAGPIKTMSSMAVANFNNYLDMVEEKSALRKNISTQNVADLALFLASDLSTHITGSTMYVDAGVHILGG